jgi:hypothetical protein
MFLEKIFVLVSSSAEEKQPSSGAIPFSGIRRIMTPAPLAVGPAFDLI